MSGGSYEYLCFKEADDLMVRPDLIHAMADRLSELGFSDAAQATVRVEAHVRQARDRITAEAELLYEVWRAVEWMDSCDWGMEKVDEAVAKWRGEDE